MALDLPTFDTTLAPTPVRPVTPPTSNSNPLVAGLKAGTYSTGAALAGLGSGAAKLVGADGVSASLGQKAQDYTADAQQVGRDDLDKASFFSSSFLPKAAYTLGQAIPGIVGAGVAGAGAVAALPEEAVAGAGVGAAGLLGRIGASLPTMFGGAGVGAGFSGAATAAQLGAGAEAAAGIGGAGAVMGALSTGEQVNTAAQQPGGLTKGNVLKAAALGLPIGIAQGLVPGEGALLARGGEGLLGKASGSVFGTAIDHGFKNAAAGAVGSGLQAAADTSYDPNMTASDRASAIVQAVVGGAQAGGLLGGAMGAFHGLRADNVDGALKSVGMDPSDPANTAPTPAPAPPPPAPVAPEPVQQELPLATPLSAAAPDTQPSLFDKPSYSPGVAPAPRTRAQALAEVKAQRDAVAAAAVQPEPDTSEAPAPLPVGPASLRTALTQADAPPPNAFAQKVLDQAGIKVGRGSSDFKDLIASSTATNPAELYNELHAVDPTSAVAQTPRFTKLASALGVGDNTLDQQLAALQADPATADVKALSLVNFKLGLRDAAAALRERPAETPADVPTTSPQAAPASADVPTTSPQAAPPVAARPISAPTLLDDVPGLEPDHGGAMPAVRPSEGSQVDQGGTATATADPTVPAIAPLVADPLAASASDPTIRADPTADATPDTGPKSIADRVLDVARSAVGDKGGEVTVADIRAALPDLAPKDIDNALREIHNDDSDTVLAKNPKGQAKGVDGVSVPGEGRFHKLDLEARTDDGVQVGGAAPEAAPDQPAGGAPDGGADTTGAAAPGAGDTAGAPEGQPGTPAVPAEDGTDPAPAQVATEARIAPQDVSAPSPQQMQLDLGKTASAERLLTAPADVQAAATQTTRALRKQTKAKTALTETPEGDQVPTDAVGASPADLPQATTSAPDPLQQIMDKWDGPGMAKVPQDRVPGVDATALPREQVEAHVARFVAKLSPDVRDSIHVVGANDPIPGRAAPLGEENLGLYRNGQVYINADTAHSLADIEDTLSHEVFGHLGNQADLGGISGQFDPGRYQTRMLGILNRAGGMDGIETLARKLGIWDGDGDDDGHNLNGGAGLKAYMPPDGKAPTPFQASQIVDELIAHRAGMTPSKLDLGIQQVQATLRKAIVNTLRRAGLHEFAKRMDRFGQPELSAWVKQTRQALTEQPKPGQVDLLAGATTPRQFLHNAEPVGEAPFLARIASKQRGTEGVMGAVDSLRNYIVNKPEAPGARGKGVLETLNGARREVVNSLMPATHFVEEGKRQGLTGIERHFEAGKGQDTAQTHLNGPGNRVAQNQMNLRSADPAQETRLSKVQALATTNNFDPRVPLAQHSWLTPEQIQERRPAYEEMKAEYDKMGKPGKGGKITNGQQIYADQHSMGQLNWYMARAMATHDILKTVFDGKVDPGHDPVRRYMGTDHTLPDGGRSIAEGLHQNVAASLAYWKGEHTRLNDLAQEHMNEEGGEQGNAGTQTYIDLAQHLKDSAEGEKSYTQQGSYFRLDRQGEFAAGFHIKPEVDADGKPTGRPDPVSFDKVASLLSEKFPNLSIGANRENGSVFARFPSEEQASNFHSFVAEGGPLRAHIDPEKGTYASLMTDPKGANPNLPFMDTMVAKLAAGFDADLAQMAGDDPQRAVVTAARDKAIGNLRAQMNDQMGETSMRSIQSRRENAQGFNADMLTGQKNAASTFARAAATSSFRTEKADALHSVQAKIEATGRSGTKDAPAKAFAMKRTFNAYNDRNAAADTRTGPSYLSTVKSWMHTYQLGFSPAYFVMNLSQLGTTGLPELAKMHGFARSTAAMISAFPEVARMIHAMATTRLDLGDGSKGPLAMHEGGITKAVLDKARLSPDMRGHISDLANHGHLEMGSYSAANSGLGLGSMSRMDRYRHYGSSTALLAETASRLVMAVAAKRLHDAMPEGPAKASMQRQFPGGALDYAGHSIQEGMFQWGSYNTPKLFTAGGKLGAAGPVVTQFHGYVPRLVEKLYRESMDGFTSRLGKGPEADQMRAESRRFVMSHLAMTMAIAGGLGLPMAGYSAAVATKLSGMFLNQPYDVEQHLRNGLDDTFGPGLGEILARGAPRYLGVDLSDLGDDGMGPFSKLMEDRRKFEDAFPAYLAHAWGSSIGAVGNMVVAGREMAEGRFSEAGARALPTALRNAVRAYRVSELGYVNSSGEKLPVPAGAAEVLKNLLGFTGGQLAEEKEREDSLSGLKDDRQYRQNEFMKTLTLARASKDPVAYQQGMDAVHRYDQDNPGVGMAQKIAAQLTNRAKAEAMGQRYGTMGIVPKDRLGISLIGQ